MYRTVCIEQYSVHRTVFKSVFSRYSGIQIDITVLNKRLPVFFLTDIL